MFPANVAVTKDDVALSNLRNGHVALSILRVECHRLLWRLAPAAASCMMAITKG